MIFPAFLRVLCVLRGEILRALLLISLLFLALIASPVFADAPTSHTVAWGETLYSIARLYGVTPQAIASANQISVNRWLYVGERLIIPTTSSAPNIVVATNGYYIVSAADTLASISSRFNVSVDALASANDLPPNAFVYVGSSLRIPSRSSSASGSGSDTGSVLTYIVQPGDSLSQIAIRYSTTAQAIALANNLPNFWLIITGQRLLIPQRAAPRAISVTASSANEIRVSNIPFYRQQQTLTCEQAAVAMATRGAVNESQLLGILPRSDNPFAGIRGQTNARFFGGLTDYGVYAQPLQKALSAFGVKSHILHGQSYDAFKGAILENLRAGRAVVWWHTWHEIFSRPVWAKASDGSSFKLVPYEHVGVIVAANDRGVTYHDPYDASARFASWADHRRVSAYFDNMALVVQ